MQAISRLRAAAGCFVSNGDFYATTVARLLGREQDGVVRIGAACYTTAAEIERVITAVSRLTTLGG